MKKAFIATIDIRICVMADDEEEARELAWNALDDEVDMDRDIEIRTMTYCPEGWEDDSVLYSNEAEDVTVKEVIDQIDAAWERHMVARAEYKRKHGASDD